MNTYLMILVTTLLLACPASAQSHFSLSQNNDQNTNQSQNPPELVEAEQLNAQALSLYKDRKYDKALSIAERVLSIREKALGSNHVLVASALRNLALILWEKGKRKEARLAYERFLTTYEKAPGVNSRQLVEAYNAYVCLLVVSGHGDESLETQRRLYKLDNGFDYDLPLNQQGKKIGAGGLMASKILDSPPPVYPAEAKSARITGSVIMKITVDEVGNVVAVNTLCGHPLLAKGAEESIRKARYMPTLVGGKPVKVTGIARYNFVLQ